MKRIWVFSIFYVLLILMFASYSALNSTITGNVISTNEPILQQPLVGIISINTNPEGANIYLNGVLQEDKFTPALIENLPVQEYKVKLTKTGYRDYETSAKIVSDRTSVISINLVEINAPHIGDNVGTETVEDENDEYNEETCIGYVEDRYGHIFCIKAEMTLPETACFPCESNADCVSCFGNNWACNKNKNSGTCYNQREEFQDQELKKYVEENLDVTIVINDEIEIPVVIDPNIINYPNPNISLKELTEIGYDEIETIDQIQVNVEDDKIVYVVEGATERNFLGILPLPVGIEKKINSDSGNVEKTNTPWWNIFARDMSVRE